MEHKRVKINKGLILTEEILRNIEEFPRKLNDVLYKDHCDGIISGFELKVIGRTIEIDKGILKKNGKIFIVNEKTEIELDDIEEKNIIKIEFDEMRETKEFSIDKFEIKIRRGFDTRDNEIELGRFNLKKGAELRGEYSAFVDFETEFNVINIRNVKYSCKNESGTLHPFIIRNFAEKVLAKKNHDILEVSFAMQALNNPIVERSLILSLIWSRMKTDKKKYSNLEIFDYLSKILKMESDSKDRNDGRSFQRERIIVD